MNRLTSWADAHRSVALDVVRVYLGVGLFARGLVFLVEPESYLDLLPGRSEEAFASLVLLHYVALAHVGGGLLLIGGLLTRLAAAVQIPILFGAAFLVHLPAGLTDQSFAFAALVLALLVVIAVWGGGPWSLDRVVAEWNERDERDEREGAAERVRQLRARERARPPAPNREPAERADQTAAAPPCACGHDRDHPRVELRRRYDGLNGLRFVTGTHPRPTSVDHVCRDCGGVVEVETDSAALEAYRFERADGL